MDSLAELKFLIDQKRDAWLKLADDVWQTPELAFKEFKAAAWQTTLLRELGFAVVAPFAGLDTAYKATRGSGSGPVFCFIAEYDALPEIGHACGHNLICSAAIAAGWATAELLERSGQPGSVVVMGTPAEESKGGKIVMLEQDALAGIDAIMMLHPSWRTTPDMGSLAIKGYEITFHGKESHASGSPDLGLNALDGVTLLFAGINAWRQQLPDVARVHGIITDGGAAANIIPGRAACRFFLRHPDEEYLTEMERRLRDIVTGAALMSATRSEITTSKAFYRSRRPNKPLNDHYVAAASALGLAPVIPETPRRGSSDFGNFSQLCPGIHPYFAITTGEIGGHSAEMAAAAASDYGKEQMLQAACAMAQVGWRYLSDARFRDEVADAFKQHSATKG